MSSGVIDLAQSFSTGGGGGGTITDVTASLPLLSSGGTTPNLSIPVADTTHNGYLSSVDWNIFNGKQATGNYITALTSDVSATGPGSVAATVNSVGGSSAANVHSAELLANAATSANTVSTIVKRDGSGNFSAGTVTASGVTIGALSGVLKASAGVVAGSATTTDLPEGTNLYYTAATVQTLAANNTSAKKLYVSQDKGSDVTGNGSLLKPYQTIQAAVTAANAIAAYYNQVIVSVYPSTTSNGYNENITLSQQGVILQSEVQRYRSDAAIIKGTITINLTGTSGGGNFVAASNAVYIHGFVIVANGTANTIDFVGTTFQRLFITDTYLDNTGTGSAINMTNTGTSGGTKSTITARDLDIENNSASNPALKVSAGRIFISGANPDISNANSATAAAILIDGASAAGCSFSITNGAIAGQVTVSDNTATATFATTSIATGSAACIVTAASPSTGFIFLANAGLNTTATNSITGSGIVVLSGAAKLSTGGDIVGTVTQSVINAFPQGAILIGATSTQTTNSLVTIKNGHLKLQQTTAPTVAAANSGTGATATLSNATDQAGRINYTTGTGVITTSAICTVTFNKAFNVAPIVVLTPQNINAGTNAVQVYVTATTTTAVLNFGVAPSISTAYNWFYQIIETQ